MSRRVLRLLVVLALLAATVVGAEPSQSQPPTDPFTPWNVTVTPGSDDPHEVVLEFDSPLLGRRVRNDVVLPDEYFDRKDPLPVVYYLHGTRDLAGDDRVAWAPKAIDSHLYFGGGMFTPSADRQRFIVVLLDALAPGDWPGWCGHCWWVEGRNGVGVAAESHLYEELIPVVEHVFGTRTDRGGRGIMGFSMGGFGAMIQGYRHPDRFAFVGALSPTIFWDGNSAALNEIVWSEYLVDQGYPPPHKNEVLYRNIEPYTLATNAVGTGLDSIILLGDGCLLSEDGACTDQDPEFAETFYRTNSEAGSARLAELGLPHYFIKREGKHGHINADVYYRLMLDRMNDVFENPPSDPHAFSYKTVDRSFEVWRYSFSVDRPNDEFVNVLGAQLDGRHFTLAGTGTATVTTPPVFKKERSYDVEIAAEDGTVTAHTVTSDASGRISLTIDLGPTRTTDERLALLNTGQFLFPHTRVRVLGEE